MRIIKNRCSRIFLLDPSKSLVPEKPDYVIINFGSHPWNYPGVTLYLRGAGFYYTGWAPYMRLKGPTNSVELKHLRLCARAYFDKNFKKFYQKITGVSLDSYLILTYVPPEYFIEKDER